MKPGAKRVHTDGPWGDKIAFMNPDGSLVMVMGNSVDRPHDIIIGFASGGDTLRVSLPAKSVNTIFVPSRS